MEILSFHDNATIDNVILLIRSYDITKSIAHLLFETNNLKALVYGLELGLIGRHCRRFATTAVQVSVGDVSVQIEMLTSVVVRQAVVQVVEHVEVPLLTAIDKYVILC